VNCWNPLKLERHSVAGNGERDGLKSVEMYNGQSAAKRLGDESKVQRLGHGVSAAQVGEMVEPHECVATGHTG
jgi:hypothetical protein